MKEVAQRNVENRILLALTGSASECIGRKLVEFLDTTDAVVNTYDSDPQSESCNSFRAALRSGALDNNIIDMDFPAQDQSPISQGQSETMNPFQKMIMGEF